MRIVLNISLAIGVIVLSVPIRVGSTATARSILRSPLSRSRRTTRRLLPQRIMRKVRPMTTLKECFPDTTALTGVQDLSIGVSYFSTIVIGNHMWISVRRWTRIH